MEGGTGFEPVNGDFADHSVSLFATRPDSQVIGYCVFRAQIIISTFFFFCKVNKKHLLISTNVIV